MNRRGVVYDDGLRVGLIEELDGGFRFTYDRAYLNSKDARPVSLSLPLRHEPHESRFLFGFFAGLLAEGQNKALQCRLLRLDEFDDFGRMLLTSQENVIGSITVQLEEEA